MPRKLTVLWLKHTTLLQKSSKRGSREKILHVGLWQKPRQDEPYGVRCVISWYDNLVGSAEQLDWMLLGLQHRACQTSHWCLPPLLDRETWEDLCRSPDSWRSTSNLSWTQWLCRNCRLCFIINLVWISQRRTYTIISGAPCLDSTFRKVIDNGSPRPYRTATVPRPCHTNDPDDEAVRSCSRSRSAAWTEQGVPRVG